jgi:diguanylate cyclase (GGDEF)-like protein
MAGGIFAICLVGSIFFGVSAAFIATMANVGGAIFSFRLFGETDRWYYLAIAVFQISTTISSIIIAIIADLERDQKQRFIDASLADSLTDLYNARYFKKRLAEEIERSTRRGTETSILFIDLDEFKLVNDNYGHSIGDRVLQVTSVFITESVRASDVVCRQGGDEFVVIFPDTSLEVAENIGARMQTRYTEYLANHESIPDGATCGLSYGTASYPISDDLESLLRRADDELYRDKRKRKIDLRINKI